MEPAKKTFGPIEVFDDTYGDPRVRVLLSRVRLPCGPIDEMITALREAANWLEWRKASEDTNG